MITNAIGKALLVASLFQPEVTQFEVAPWPERVFDGKYPRSAKPENRKAIPGAYATELQTVMNALNNMKQDRVEWDCGTRGIGVLVSDSLMFQRGDPSPSDLHMSHFYGLAMPLLKRGIPVTPVQLENVTSPHYLDGFKVLLLTYQGMKPLSADVHLQLADWVKRGGVLLFCDDDSDPFNGVREWWNTNGVSYHNPREHLFEQVGFKTNNVGSQPAEWRFGKGAVTWMRENPVQFARETGGADEMVALVHHAAELGARLKWREANYLSLRRGPYVIAAGLDESVPGAQKVLKGRFINLFDSKLVVQTSIQLDANSHFMLRDLDADRAHGPEVLESACKALVLKKESKLISMAVEGVGETPAVVLLRSSRPPRTITLDKETISDFDYSAKDELLWVRFINESRPRTLSIQF